MDGGPKKPSFFLLKWFNGLGLFWLDLTPPGLTTLQVLDSPSTCLSTLPQVLQERYGFTCSCPRCSLHRATQLPACSLPI